MKLARTMLLLASLLLAGRAGAQVSVSNVRAEQRVGTTLVDVYYNVTAVTPTVSVGLEVRDGMQDGTPVVPSAGATGHVGAGVPIGTDRHILWDAGEEWGLWKATLDMRFAVTADTEGPIIALSGDLSFSNLPEGQTATGTFTISNEGNETLVVTGIKYPPGFSGNWTGSIAPGGSRNVTVTFAPMAAQEYGGYVTVQSNAAGGENTHPIDGLGIAATRLIGLSGNLSFGNLVTGQTATRTLTISNTGNSSMNVTGINYPAGFSGNWSGTIDVGGSRDVTVTFAPTAVQSYGGDLTVNANHTSGTNMRGISGTGIAPTRVIGLSGDLAFGDVGVGTTATRILTISNTGNSPLNVTGVSYPAGFSGNWSGMIAVGGSRDVTVNFVPTAVQGYGGNVSVSSDATSGTNTRSVSGTGVSRIIGLSGDLSFGEVDYGETATRTLTISNTGNRALTVTGINYPVGFSGNWSGTIASGGSQQVTVSFIPANGRYYSGNLTVSSDATSGTNTRGVSGTGIMILIYVSSGNMDFGGVVVGQTATRTMNIWNGGLLGAGSNRDLNVTGINYPSGFSGDWSGGTIAPGASRNVTVTFAPTAAESYGGNISVSSDANYIISATEAASGTGITRIIDLSDNMAFGDVMVRQTVTRMLKISNTGNWPLNVTGISYPAGFSGNWSGTIAAGGSQDVTVTFAPTAVQSYGGILNVISDATSGTDTQAISGTAGLWSGIDPTSTSHEMINDRWVKNLYADGHVTMGDRTTGWMWVYDASANGTANRDNAIAHCNNLTYAGHSDWFLPNRSDLRDMYSEKALFANVQEWYWSSTPHWMSGNGYAVNMESGTFGYGPYETVAWIWPCRSGP